MEKLKNITGAMLIDATAAFLNGAGLGTGEDKNKVIPKTFREKVNGRSEEVPYVSAQAWRRCRKDNTLKFIPVDENGRESYGPFGVGKGAGLYFSVTDLNQDGRLDIAVAGKDGLAVFWQK